MKIEEQIARAESLVGKKIIHEGAPSLYPIEKWGIADSLDGFSEIVKNVIKRDKFCVYLKGGAQYFPALECEEYIQNIVRLNSSYIAEVFEDHVKVGCQTFPIESIQEILKVHSGLVKKELDWPPGLLESLMEPHTGHKWVYRGIAWKNDGKDCFYAYNKGIGWVYGSTTPSGSKDCHYAEMIKIEKPRYFIKKEWFWR